MSFSATAIILRGRHGRTRLEEFAALQGLALGALLRAGFGLAAGGARRVHVEAPLCLLSLSKGGISPARGEIAHYRFRQFSNLAIGESGDTSISPLAGEMPPFDKLRRQRGAPRAEPADIVSPRRQNEDRFSRSEKYFRSISTPCHFLKTIPSSPSHLPSYCPRCSHGTG